MKKIIDVVAGVFKKKGKVMIARRAKDEHLEFMWEFPGGKIDPGETPQESLKRELKEEFGVNTNIGEYICDSYCNYGDKNIHLIAYEVTHTTGEFFLTVHDDVRWVSYDQLDRFDFAPADIPIVRELKLRNKMLG